MNALITRSDADRGTPLILVDTAHFDTVRERLTASQQSWLSASGFEPQPGRTALLPGDDGTLAAALVAIDTAEPVWALSALPWQLPAGNYALADGPLKLDPTLAALGWALGSYRFTRYRAPSEREVAKLIVDASVHEEVTPLAAAAAQVRDLVNTPAEDMGPEQVADAIQAMGKEFGADVRQWVGDELLENNFPTIHAVGRASHRAPRLVELSWGKESDPRLTLVGKGVCFDTGGLDLKPSAGMRWMKKDMGGAAHAMGLARLVMSAGLPVRLTLLIPTVENSVAGAAMRPGDVIRTRAGHTVEVDNTDAEGRLILCDALAYGGESQPDLMLDFATLTGAARVALGPDLPVLFTNRDELSEAAMGAARGVHDPIWPLPLWQPYRRMLDSYLADFANSGGSRHAGAITAALYLERFVPEATPWIHVDVYAWNDADRPGRPRGGEAQSLRAFFAFLKQRYAA
ncbi:leucyl aminopeptidase family protein [Oleiagrimonas sp. C23AA]|uniref:leucyl aminopeptidase family protein n=1 Tax=Oleiagrimonas sp. C23AA TaxID=2719047 RepID=UPI001423A5EE|nr:leucyl aminopeptidase family protein [Oleiagrimonas sp. C23AA]NII09666.1 leucyl aminopeptidase family protein [Oleiagrimonas sp. C23AA]